MDRHDWDERYREKELVWTAEPNRFLVAELENMRPGKALDVAAGEGRNAVWLAERGWRVVALDFSSVALEKGRKMAEKRGVSVDWRNADVERCSFDEGAYDLVIVLYLHLPWEKMQPVLERAQRALAPAGTFLCVGHDRTNLSQGYGGPQDAGVLYTPEQVVSALGGLEIEKAERVIREVSTDEGPKQAIDNLVRAVRRPAA